MLLSEAKKILESKGFCVLTEKTDDELEFIINVYIKHDTVQRADMTSKEGRRTYHQLARSYGLKESEEVQKMGGATVGMFHKSSDKVNKSWTWIDMDDLKEKLAKYGFDISEQHTQATVSKDVEDEPVVNWGHTGAYGENSSEIYYFITTSERTWQIKLVGTLEKFTEFMTDRGENLDGSMDDLVTCVKHDDGVYHIEKLIKSVIPAYKTDDNYEVKVNVKFN